MIYEILAQTPKEMFEFGRQLGTLLQAGDLLAFTGSLGAGKTCCIQGVAIGLGVPKEIAVTSPTYTLIHEYQGRLPLYHFDVYRLGGEEDLYDLGYEEYFYGNGVTVIEWAERIEAFLPDERLALYLNVKPDESRVITLQTSGERYEHLLCSFIALGSDLTMGDS